MRTKHVEERFSPYFVFGANGNTVDVASSSDDCVATVTDVQAEKLIENRQKLLDMLQRVVNKLDEIDPDALDTIWYE